MTGHDRVKVAALARSVRLGSARPAGSPDGSVGDTVVMLAATPARTDRPWVDAVVGELGERRYIEVTGVVSRVVAIDTFSRLLGVEPEPLPEPVTGAAQAEPTTARTRRGKAWVSMAGFQTPPNVLSLVPTEQAATNAVAEALYMTGAQMEDPDTSIDGLHRTQIETVATTVSHGNECFY